MPNNGDTSNFERLDEVLEPETGTKMSATRRRVPISLISLGLAVAISLGVTLWQNHHKPAPVDPNATSLQERGFENVEAIPGKDGRYWASVAGFNPQCKFTFFKNDSGEWVLTRAASSRGYGDFTLENPNAAQLQAQFPDLLAGCELNAAPASPSATG